MSGRRPQVVAHRQDVRLARLAVARDYRPGRPASLDPDELPILALLAALEHALELARLGRMQADDAEDGAWRRVVVVVGAAASAVAADVRSGNDDATPELFTAISTYQRRNA